MKDYKKIKILLFIAALLGLFFYFISQNYSICGNKIKTISVSGRRFKVEEASTPYKIEKGLSGRDSLCENCGMIFEFPEEGKYGFWMKGMKFSLDIVWIDGNKIVYIAKNISSDFSGIIEPESPADKVLEINAGVADKLNLKEGGRIDL